MGAGIALDGMMESLSRCLNPESARRLAEWKIDASTQERMEILAALANEGVLSDDDRTEYEALITAADLISILKLKARRHLESTTQ